MLGKQLYIGGILSHPYPAWQCNVPSCSLSDLDSSISCMAVQFTIMNNVVPVKMSSVLSLLQAVEILNQFDFHLHYTRNCISAFYIWELQKKLAIQAINAAGYSPVCILPPAHLEILRNVQSVHGCEQEKSSVNHWFIPFANLFIPKEMVMDLGSFARSFIICNLLEVLFALQNQI
jgi:hypothetical protein